MILPIAVVVLGGPLRLEAKWTAPKELPFERVHSVVHARYDYYVGGIKGLYKGRPGHWTRLEDRPVRQMLYADDAIWVLFGDGSVDKLDVNRDRLVFDFLVGRVKRPWASCLSTDPSYVMIGGQGGWFASGNQFSEIYRKELDSQVVTSICKQQDTTWIGTQKQGVFGYTNGGMKRYGYVAGVPDSWVTAMAVLNEQLIVGVADGGVVRFAENRFTSVDSPSKKVRHLIVFKGNLVVGGMEGCWIKNGDGWQQLSGEETTHLGIVGGRLAVGTPAGLGWWQK